MTPCRQLIKHNPPEAYGDCMRSCVAALLDLRPEDVPHFIEDGESDGDVVWARVEKWLAIRNLFVFSIVFAADVPEVLEAMSMRGGNGILYLLGCGSPRADHLVVACGGSVVCDPAGYAKNDLRRGSDGYCWVHILLPKTQTTFSELWS